MLRGFLFAAGLYIYCYVLVDMINIMEVVRGSVFSYSARDAMIEV